MKYAFIIAALAALPLAAHADMETSTGSNMGAGMDMTHDMSGTMPPRPPHGMMHDMSGTMPPPPPHGAMGDMSGTMPPPPPHGMMMERPQKGE